MMVYNEAGEPGRGKEVVLVNPKITKFSKTKDLFEEGCLSFPKIYADVEVRYL
jgi:peptide deformylase